MSVRNDIMSEVTERKAVRTICDASKGRKISDIYGTNVFNDAAMRRYLPAKAFRRLKKVVREGGKIDAVLAEEVACGMKEWATAKGASHFTHWFHPLTGLTAEKHDSFLNFDENGEAIERFSGKTLIQGEPDASSFPSGGLRSTFEARGYTAWDPTSPAFIAESLNGATLVVPTIFLSYTGEALDKKTPLLRSMEALSLPAVRLLRLFGNASATRVNSTVGPEQEYFLIDRSYFNRRYDLILTGRTLFGAKPPKGQEMEDHYFGSIRERILAFMQDAEMELFKLGIPVKTRHNEVAPAQFEIAPVFEDCNIATDHNQVIMEVLRKVASKHNLALLLHEKPFVGINGSGKHNNWSMSDADGNNLLEPGRTPHDNLQFLTFLLGTMKAVHKYSDLLRASIASPSNDHRLGANEAPPAIISVFLGEQLTQVLDNIEANRKAEYSDSELFDLGLNKLPAIKKDQTDRNRTSPFAFTGNKFEFRAVGSSQSIGPANYTLNTIVADILTEFADRIEANMKSGMNLNKAVMEVLLPVIKETKPIRFEGNNYDPEWEKEAARRGLPNKKNMVDAVKDLVSRKNKDVFIRHKVFAENEIESRHTIALEHYIKTVNIEAETTISIAKTLILPAAVRYETVLGSAAASLAALKSAPDACETRTKMCAEYADLVCGLVDRIRKLEATLAKRDVAGGEEKKAEFYCKEVLPAMNAVREIADRLEEETDDALWPLPKYREMLFVY